jgi:hypothetical protein
VGSALLCRERNGVGTGRGKRQSGPSLRTLCRRFGARQI